MKYPAFIALLAVFSSWAPVSAPNQETKSDDRGAATAASGIARDERRENETRSEIVPGKEWKYVASMEKAGWSREKLGVARQYGESIHSSAMMIVQVGEVVEEGGDVDTKISSYSVRKSLISALYGIYSAEGVIDANATLEQMGIDDAPDPLTKGERQARVVDLLRARSGIYHPVDFETPYQKRRRDQRGGKSRAGGTW